MNRIKNWIRWKLIQFLGIEALTNLIDKHIENNDDSFKNLRSLIYDLNSSTRKDVGSQISHFQESVNVLHNTVENVVHIGTDVRHPQRNERSWAVICVEGKMNIVKFVSLDGRDARDLIQYLKRFEAGRHCIDAPYSEMFIQEFFKF